MINNITAIFCFIDDFLRIYQKHQSKGLIKMKNKRNREGNMSLSEMMTIMICFHFSGYRTFKHYYLYCIGIQYQYLFFQSNQLQ